jgi:hypothetical protein
MSFHILTTRGRDLLLIATFAVIAMLPMYFYGVTGGNDQQQHYQFAWTVYQSIKSGEIYPGVAGDTNRGFGDVGLRFYPPLTYYILASAYAGVGDWFYASLLAFTLVFFAGGLGIYLWACEEFDRRTALIAAAIYTLAPYHLNVIYTNGLMAEFFAAAILPFCFLYLTRLCRGGRWLDVLGFATACALMILTHLPMAIIGSIAMALYALVLIKKQTLLPVIGKCLVSAALALAMTAFYWARMLPELDWVKHSSQKYFETTWSYTSNYLLYPSHFTRFGDDALNLWLADLMLLATVLIAVPSAVWLVLNRTSMTRYVMAVIIVALFSVFMTTPLSSLIWDHFNILQKVQFPWRWLSVITAFTAVLAAVGIKRAADVLKTGYHYAVAAGLGAVLVVFVFMAAFIMKGASYTPKAALNEQVANIPASSGCECWWPVWAEWAAFGQTEQVKADGRTAMVKNWAAEHKVFEIGPGESASVTIATFYYPHWHASVNGSEITVNKTVDGRISLPVPGGASDVDLVFREPAYVRVAYTISILSWSVVICLSAALLFNNGRRPAASL